MTNFFGTIFSDSMTVGTFFLMVGVAVANGLLISFIFSFKMHSSKRFFISNAITPAVVAMVIALVNGNIGVGVAVAGAFGLVRYIDQLKAHQKKLVQYSSLLHQA